MRKQVARLGAWSLIWAVQLAQIGCGSKPPAPAAGLDANGQGIPTSVIKQMQSMPPEARQHIIEQSKNSPNGDQVKQALDASPPPAAASAPPSGSGQ